MADYPPLFFIGKSDGQTGITMNVGDYWINGAVRANFPVGTHVWASASDYSATVYRGTVLELHATVESVRTSIAAPATITGGRIWNPTAQWIATHAPASPARNEYDLGVVNVESLDRTLFRSQVRDVRETMVFTWTMLSCADATLWRAFLVTSLSYGVSSFTVRWYDWLSSASRFGTCKLENAEHTMANARAGYGPLALSAVLQTEDTYT